MPLTATLKYIESNADSVSLNVELQYLDLPTLIRTLKYRTGEDLLLVNVVPFVLAEAARIEALVDRGTEFEALVGTDVYLALSDADPPQPNPTLEAVVDRVVKTYDAVTVHVRVTHRVTGKTATKVVVFTDSGQMTRPALQGLLNSEGVRLAGLGDILPYVEPLVGVDLVAWARTMGGE